MKNAVDVFTELGDRLTGFGQDAVSQYIVADACRQNNWFLPAEVTRAVQAVRTEFLCRTKLTDWLGCYQRPATLSSRTVLVVMAGNIPLVGFFDLLCVVVAGHRCLIKLSGKDTVLMQYIIENMKCIEPEIPVAIYTEGMSFDAVVATGSDNANRYFRANYAGVRMLLRGNRHSVAVLNGRETPEQRAALSEDLFAYSGLGCRNVSLLFVPAGSSIVPDSRSMNPKYINNYRQCKALHDLCGRPYTDLGYALLVAQKEFPQELSEISVVEYTDRSQVDRWLCEHDAELQCVVSECVEHSRRVSFGRSQYPTLRDYPDAVDVIEFMYRL